MNLGKEDESLSPFLYCSSFPLMFFGTSRLSRKANLRNVFHSCFTIAILHFYLKRAPYLLASSPLKDAEIHAAITAMLNKMGVSREIIVLAVFENQHTRGLQQIVLENEIGHCRQFREIVWRIGKDEIELGATCFQETENITSDKDMPFGAHFFHTLTDEVGMITVGFHTDHRGTSTRKEF